MSVIVLMGRSCCGKSSIQKELQEKYGYSRVVTCTTRSPREGEIDGTHYHFITKKQFLKMKANGDFAETTEYAKNMYGTLIKDISGCKDQVIVLETEGAVAVKKSMGYNAFVVYLYVDDETVSSAFRERGDEASVVKQRLESDAKVFVNAVNVADFIIDNSGFKKSIEELAMEVDKVAKSYFRNFSQKNHILI